VAIRQIEIETKIARRPAAIGNVKPNLGAILQRHIETFPITIRMLALRLLVIIRHLFASQTFIMHHIPATSVSSRREPGKLN
jgi:hypothetical protein